MQYILTQQEYDELLERKQHHIKLERSNLQALCTQIANEMPVKWGRGAEPWGCILTEENEWYCDKCPVQEICPSDRKDWSQ